MLSSVSKIIKLSNYRLLNNFPKDFSIFRKALSNLVFFILNTKTTGRLNLLTKADFVSAKEIIQKGDVILVRDSSRVFRFFSGKYFSHALLYIGEDTCIHANIDGVNTILFEKLFEEYDSLLIIRANIKGDFKETINKAIEFAKRKIGLAYNFYFEHRQDRYICTQLIESSFLESGIDLKISSQCKNKKGRFRIFSRIRRVIKADDLLKGDFKVIYFSKEIREKSYYVAKKKGQLILKANL